MAAADRYEMAILAATGGQPLILNPYISPKVTFHGVRAGPVYLTIRWRRKRETYIRRMDSCSYSFENSSHIIRSHCEIHWAECRRND